MRLTLAVLAALIASGAAAAKPPPAGVLVPSRSLGGVRLGMTGAQVQALWGSTFGRCRGCRHPTWYFDYAPFKPQGTGVELRGGRVVATFTLWAPSSWHTPKRLRIGDPVARLTQLYGALPRVECGGYYALTQPRPGATTAYYVREETIWGFGLSRPEIPVCR